MLLLSGFTQSSINLLLLMSAVLGLFPYYLLRLFIHAMFEDSIKQLKPGYYWLVQLGIYVLGFFLVYLATEYV